MAEVSAARRTPRQVLCPHCGKLAPWAGNPYRPFCSERCRLIDLGAWASEDYGIPTREPAPEEPIPTDHPSKKPQEE